MKIDVVNGEGMVTVLDVPAEVLEAARVLATWRSELFHPDMAWQIMGIGPVGPAVCHAKQELVARLRDVIGDYDDMGG